MSNALLLIVSILNVSTNKTATSYLRKKVISVSYKNKPYKKNKFY